MTAAGTDDPTAAPTVITVYADGPYVVTGAVEIRTGDGVLVKSATKLALCRCGQSQTKPYCDSTHRKVGFTDPGPVPDTETTQG